MTTVSSTKKLCQTINSLYQNCIQKNYLIHYHVFSHLYVVQHNNCVNLCVACHVNRDIGR